MSRRPTRKATDATRTRHTPRDLSPAPQAKPITEKQRKAIFGLGKPLGFGYDELHEMAVAMTGHGLSEMSFTEANAMIKHLGGTPFGERGKAIRGQSLRNQQHKRQQAGVKQLSSVSPSHLDLMRSWGRKVNLEGDSLKVFINSQLGHDWPRTTAETSRIIQTLKSMHGRGWKAGQAQQEAA